MAEGNRWRRGLSVTKQAAGFVASHKWLIVYPLLGFLCSSLFLIVVTFSFFDSGLGSYFDKALDETTRYEELGSQQKVPRTGTANPTQDGAESSAASSDDEKVLYAGAVVGFFILYFGVFFFLAFFNVALVACALKIFRGEKAGFAYGLAVSFSRLRTILAWSFFVAAVGTVLRILESRGPVITRYFSLFAGFAWGLATFFVVPVIVAEDKGAMGAIERSVRLIKDTWGEFIVVNIGIRSIYGFVGFVFMGLLMLLMSSVKGEAQATLVLLAPVIGFFIFFILNGIATVAHAALYHFATRHAAPPEFDDAVLQNAISRQPDREVSAGFSR